MYKNHVTYLVIFADISFFGVPIFFRNIRDANTIS